ncbi:MAG TPA: hypothetical protein VHB21_12545, partial [Minicystis sp.]|nr:hypothetical protein [Minicystis sp.]
MKRAIVLALAPLAALAVGCAEPAPGTIADARVPLANLGAGVGAPVDVAPPRDARPALEHQGDADRTSFFFTVGVVTYWRRRGNYVTNDFAASPDLPRELRAVLSGALYASRAASPPAPGAPPAFELAVDVEHLYATHYAANDGTVVVVPGKRSAGGGASTTRREYASYGNVVLLARLVDRRGGRNAVIWEEHVTG